MIGASTTSWLFVYDMRLSTMLLWLAFVVAGVFYREMKRALLAGMTWLLGWEIAWQITKRLITVHRPLGWDVLVYVGSAALVLALQRKTVRPSLPLIGLSLCIGAVWVATGFHVNGYNDLASFSPLGEALNEGAKTAWGLAYLWPLRDRWGLRPARAVQEPVEDGDQPDRWKNERVGLLAEPLEPVGPPLVVGAKPRAPAEHQADSMAGFPRSRAP